MSAATKRNALAALESLDAEARNAVRKAARHAGMSLDEWLAAVSGERMPEAAPARRTTKRNTLDPSNELNAAVAKLQSVAKLAHKPAGIAAEELEDILARASEATERRTREQATKTAVALDSVASWIEQAEDRLSAASRSGVERQERTAEMLGRALGAMTRRLDDIEGKLADGGRPSLDAALKAVERIESQLAKRGAGGGRGSEEAVHNALRGFETRIAELSDRIAAVRPTAPPHNLRPRPDIKSAVAEIRARQAELDRDPAAAAEPPGGERPPAPRAPEDVLQSLRGDIARLAGQLQTLRPDEARSREVAGLRSEIERLQAMVGGLATRDEVNALERSLADLVARVANARAPIEIAAVSGPIEELQSEVRRIADLVTTGIHGRLARDVEGLARRIDAAAGFGADPNAVNSLDRQFAELRKLLAEMAEPQRVHALAAQLSELNERLADLGRRQLDAHAVERRFDALSQQLDRLGEKPRITFSPPAEGIDTLVQRLDRLDETLTRGNAPQLGPIEEMLRTLVDRADQVGRSGTGVDALDSLEKQISLLARRLERGSSDPALAGLERTMGDLMSQVELMRSGAYEAADRAAKAAVAETLAALPNALSAEPQVVLVRRDLDDLKTHQSSADKRIQMTLESVHAALEKVVTRLATLEHDERVVGPTQPPAIDLPQTICVKAPAPGAQAPQPTRAGTAPQITLDEADRPLPPAEEILLEPGATRPRPGQAAAAPALEPHLDVRANLIAAARRAAQAAATEAATNKAKNARPGASFLSRAEGAKAGLAARMKGVVDKHRRPILLGLAAIVLALGAMRVIGGMVDSSPSPAMPKAETRLAAPIPPAPPTAPVVETAPAKPAETTAPEGRAEEPRTTQAIPGAGPAKPEGPAPSTDAKVESRASTFGGGPKTPTMMMPTTAAPLQIAPAAPAMTGAIDPRLRVSDPIPNIASVGELPTAPGLGGLRQATLAGNPIAAYDMAARLAEGRGYSRDLKLAAKLFEKAAGNGVVPAQYRIGNHYEKALGVSRDVALAKAWYQRAADKGNARAMHNLAVLLAEGGDGKPDYAGAAEWFRKAAEHGVKDSQFNLAVLLARGLGVSQNLARAYTWFAVVAAQGDQDAGKKRDEVGARLATAELNEARAAADGFKPIVADRAANEVAVPAQGWAEPAPATTRKAPANAQHPAGPGRRV